jgi:hypothetical protein
MPPNLRVTQLAARDLEEILARIMHKQNGLVPPLGRPLAVGFAAGGVTFETGGDSAHPAETLHRKPVGLVLHSQGLA